MTDADRTVEAVWRIEAARLIAGLARIVRDVGLAEDLAQEALVAALEQWPESGVPHNPGAWLMGSGALRRTRAADALAGRRAQPGRRRRYGIRPRDDARARGLLGSDPSLEGYHLLPAVRGDLLAKLGRNEEARAELRRAVSLTENARERDLLLERAAEHPLAS